MNFLNKSILAISLILLNSIAFGSEELDLLLLNEIKQNERMKMELEKFGFDGDLKNLNPTLESIFEIQIQLNKDAGVGENLVRNKEIISAKKILSLLLFKSKKYNIDTFLPFLNCFSYDLKMYFYLVISETKYYESLEGATKTNIELGFVNQLLKIRVNGKIEKEEVTFIYESLDLLIEKNKVEKEGIKWLKTWHINELMNAYIMEDILLRTYVAYNETSDALLEKLPKYPSHLYLYPPKQTEAYDKFLINTLSFKKDYADELRSYYEKKNKKNE